MQMVDTKLEALRLRSLTTLRKNAERRYDSYQFAGDVSLLFRNYVDKGKYKDTELIRNEGDYLLSMHPTEFILRNILYATLKIVREEAQRLAYGEEEPVFDSLSRLWLEARDDDLNVNLKQLKRAVMGSLEEFSEDLKNCKEDLAARAPDHVVSTDTIMTYKYSVSSTLQDFLKNTRCCIISAGDESSDDKKLPFNGIKPTEIVVTMGSVTRVVLSAVAVLPDGSCIMSSGTRAICEVARQHSVPVIVCSAFFKFTPVFVPSLEEFNQYASGGALLGEDSELLSLPHVRLANPLFDLIPAKLVSLYVTQSAAVSPSHVYRLLGEFYHPADFYRYTQ